MQHARSIARFLEYAAESVVIAQKIKDYNKFAMDGKNRRYTAYIDGQKMLDSVFRENPGRTFHVILRKHYTFTHDGRDAIIVLPWHIHSDERDVWKFGKFVAVERPTARKQPKFISLLFSDVDLSNCPDYISAVDPVFAYKPDKYPNVWTYWKSDLEGHEDPRRPGVSE